MTMPGLSGAGRCNFTIYPEEERSKHLWTIFTTVLGTRSQVLVLRAKLLLREVPALTVLSDACGCRPSGWPATYGEEGCALSIGISISNLRLEYLLASPPAPASGMHHYPFWTPKLETQSHPQPSHIHPDTNHQPPQQSGICHLLEAPAAVVQVQDLSLIWITAKSKPLLRSLLCLLSKSSSMPSLVECSSIANIILILPNLITSWQLPLGSSRLRISSCLSSFITPICHTNP